MGIFSIIIINLQLRQNALIWYSGIYRKEVYREEKLSFLIHLLCELCFFSVTRERFVSIYIL
ncbi:hypothetical protein DW668_12680 [Bacteroides stercoris]|uniref:Uncharacterized protein n=1 Tax=Bacteroides stercoris TaxID=46506 RepID=A0A414PX25_BACSE|nr:hypothetical protein DW668_12680 [Bacteroides stercoris]HAX57402.1 hypothetical protein [Bacteroides stercoris]